MTIHEKLNEIQQNLKAPKSQWNKFGKYPYRSCEDILEAVKPLLGEDTLLISDEMILVGDRVYVKATATLMVGKEAVSVSANAREAVTKKGMDDSQITGTSSSYARKYALNGLFLIDDTKDADSVDNSAPAKKKGQFPELKDQPPELTSNDLNWISAISMGKSKLEDITDPDHRKFIESKLK